MIRAQIHEWRAYIRELMAGHADSLHDRTSPRAGHGGHSHASVRHRLARPLSSPIFQTTAFARPSGADLSRVAIEVAAPDFYTRHGNPNHVELADAVATLEGAERGLVFGSGMGALTTAVLALVRAGDHVVAQRSMYGGSLSLVQALLPRLGVECTLVEQTDVSAWADAVTPATRLFLIESPSNPRLEITDIAAVAAIARERDIVTLADNTFATPVNQRPIALGVDLVWHSATKYLAGHSDTSAGVIVGPDALIEKIWNMSLTVGAVLGPFDAWLVTRGIRTLHLRVERHNTTGAIVAEHLSRRPEIAVVNYPGLHAHPSHAIAARQMDGFGGVLSLVLQRRLRCRDEDGRTTGAVPAFREPRRRREPRGTSGVDVARRAQRRRAGRGRSRARPRSSRLRAGRPGRPDRRPRPGAGRAPSVSTLRECAGATLCAAPLRHDARTTGHPPHERESAMQPSEQPNESPGWAANPNYVIDWDLVPATVSVSFNGKVVAESDQVRVMYELGHAPVYYFPKSALNPQFFEKVADHHTYCPYKGVASYMTLTVGDKSQPNGVWMYENPYPQQEHLRDHVGFYWGKMDEWREDGERVPARARFPAASTRPTS